MYKNQLPFYTITPNCQKNKKIISFIKALKRIKYLGINLTKEASKIYTENSKVLMKKTEDTNR